MTNWFFPAGSAADGPWDLSLGTYDSSTSVEGWKHTGIKTATFTNQPLSLEATTEERIIVPLTGDVTVSVKGQVYELSGRSDVFHGPADVLYTGINAAVELRGKEGVRVAIATGPAKAEYPVRHLKKEEVPVELRGAGTSSRQVHNFGTPASLEADRLIVCEVITPGGNWSSYPPHKHDEEREGEETALEEIYYFETRATPGAPAEAKDAIGYQRVYASDARPIDVNEEVRTGDVVLVPYGWHGPAMAAPGYDLYYLNVMAGPGPVREWLISDDPHHGWVRQVWEGQQIDPRLPFTADQ
ncbi:5-deoxy-glucuronate isomerase [Rothia sp. ZJ932]|uniref:5-deoxy-glucuronate isomerase n=1 Tax=Rothia sp. ZJ932 TaxID=2810516 RepID=UPI0019672379|nr:5-deoxy-glucuronate isomerase [Rothia sp. ZJ932]QRZ61475.1 5-deoxy-glucuronate isomerase [Rothia sp. ZJ932]